LFLFQAILLPETATLSMETGDFVSVSSNLVAVLDDYSSGNKIAAFRNRCGQAFRYHSASLLLK